VHIYRGTLTLHEHTYFASRELGIVYQTEPLIGNYALTYALGLCHAPYRWSGGPRYRQDLEPLNVRGVYVTPATFQRETVRFAVTQFNAQSDAYRTLFANNAIIAPGSREVPVREGQRWFVVNVDTGSRRRANATNFPQSGKIRMLALGSRASFYLLDERGTAPRPAYIRLGKFNSKARIEWTEARWEEADGEIRTPLLLNAVDLPSGLRLVAYNQVSVHPAPLLRDIRATGPHYRLGDGTSLPAGMRFGVAAL
jgi:CRISPR-associated protein Csc1